MMMFPEIDERSEQDILNEFHNMIARYLPQWNPSKDDSGMALAYSVIFMQMEMIKRLNQVPKLHYISFLNFIGEELRSAESASVLLTFTNRIDTPQLVPKSSVCTTQQTKETKAIKFKTDRSLMVHSSEVIEMIMTSGTSKKVRTVPILRLEHHRSVSFLNSGFGAFLFLFVHPNNTQQGYTEKQYVLIEHSDFVMWRHKKQGNMDLVGDVFLYNASSEALIPMFKWFCREQTRGDFINKDIKKNQKQTDSGREFHLTLEDITPSNEHILSRYPEASKFLTSKKSLIIGKIDFDSWFEEQIRASVRIFWQTDWGGDPEEVLEWELRRENHLLFFVLTDVPPLLEGWKVDIQIVNPGLDWGYESKLPMYKWAVLNQENYEMLDDEQIRQKGYRFEIFGPLPGRSEGGVGLQAIRVESVNIQNVIPDFQVQTLINHPITLDIGLYENNRYRYELSKEFASYPFQFSPDVTPMINQGFVLSSPFFTHTQGRSFYISFDVLFSFESDPIEDPKDLYALRMMYSTKQGWKTVFDPTDTFTRFCFTDFETEDSKASNNKKIHVRIILEEEENTPNIANMFLNEKSQPQLYIELIKSNLNRLDKKRNPIGPIDIATSNFDCGFVNDNARIFTEELLGCELLSWEVFENNRRFDRIQYMQRGQYHSFSPNLPFVALEGDPCLYFSYSKAIPEGGPYSLYLEMSHENFLPDTIDLVWEYLLETKYESTLGKGIEYYWKRLKISPDSDDFLFQRTGTLRYYLDEEIPMTSQGVWLRARFIDRRSFLEEKKTSIQDVLRTLPRLTYAISNAVYATQMSSERLERFSSNGSPHQEIQLQRSNIIWKKENIKVIIDENNERHEWHLYPYNERIDLQPQDKVFFLDPIKGMIFFGDGIHGKIPEYGSSNILVQFYNYTQGASGNCKAGEIVNCDFSGVLDVLNPFSSVGGRESQSIEEKIEDGIQKIVDRDRAIGANDFTRLAKEATSQIHDVRTKIQGGVIELILLPKPVGEQKYPEPKDFRGLRDFVASYVRKRSLISLDLKVRLVQFEPVDLRLVVSVHKGSVSKELQQKIEDWIFMELNPYTNRLSFGNSIHCDVFLPIIQIEGVRHVKNCFVYDHAPLKKGWNVGGGVENKDLSVGDLFSIKNLKVDLFEE
jgi:hypothetical protein